MHAVLLAEVLNFICQWNSWGMGTCGKVFWGYLIRAVFWSIWKERNRRIFEGKGKSTNEVSDSIVGEVGNWLHIN